MSPTTPPQPALATPRKRDYTAPWWQLHAWGVGAIASYFMYEQFYLIANIHTTVFKVNPTLVGIILAMPRLIDGLLDPLIAHWSDNMRGRFGRRRPFLLFAGLLGAVLASAIFWMSPESAQWIKGVILAFSSVALFTACGTYDMAFQALGFELSDDYADRSRVQAIKNVYWAAMGIIGGYMVGLATDAKATGDHFFGEAQTLINMIGTPWHWITHTPSWTPVILNWWHSWRHLAGFSSQVHGFRVISACVSGLIVVSLLFPLFWSRERFVKINRTHVDVWKSLKATLRCKPFAVILFINIAGGAGTLPRKLFFFVGVYYVCRGNMAEYSNAMAGDFALVAFFISLIIWPLARPLTKLIGKRTAFITVAALGLVQSILTPMVATPGHVHYWFLLNTSFLPILMLLGAATAGIMPDICDIDELEHGERREGMFTAVQAFINKMEISVMVLLTGVFLSLTGFDANLGPIQKPEVLNRMWWMAFAPLVFFSAIAFVISFYFPINEEMMRKVRAELDVRHAASGVPGVALDPQAPSASP